MQALNQIYSSLKQFATLHVRNGRPLHFQSFEIDQKRRKLKTRLAISILQVFLTKTYFCQFSSNYLLRRYNQPYSEVDFWRNVISTNDICQNGNSTYAACQNGVT